LTPPPTNPAQKGEAPARKDDRPDTGDSKAFRPPTALPVSRSQDLPVGATDPPSPGTERVSQWRPMLRRSETAAVPLVPPRWDGDSPSRAPTAAPPRPLILKAVAQQESIPFKVP